MRRLRILAEIIVVGSIAAYGGANFVLSGEKFTWPPPKQLEPAALWESAKTQAAKLTGK
jgi:hypothetical protein